MSQSVTVSFRDQTTGRISDLLADEGLPCAQSQNLLAYFAGALVNYREEGITLDPSILFCRSIEIFLRTFPGSIHYTIGTVPLSVSSGPKILKDCAPITGRNWRIFVERSDEALLKYGVFTHFSLPTSIPLQEGITIDATQFGLLMRKIGANTVEIRGSMGNVLTLLFSTFRGLADSTSSINKFATSCCRNLSGRNREEFMYYLGRLPDDSLKLSHGTILVSTSAPLTEIAELKDAVLLSPILDLNQMYQNFRADGTAEALMSLQQCEELLVGFMRSDGISVFQPDGQVSAYRVFFRPAGPIADTPAGVVGGARRRAYEGIKTLIGNQLNSVLFRSQDGETLFWDGASV